MNNERDISIRGGTDFSDYHVQQDNNKGIFSLLISVRSLKTERAKCKVMYNKSECLNFLEYHLRH